MSMPDPRDDIQQPIPPDQAEHLPPTVVHSDVLTSLRQMYESFINGTMSNERRFLLGKQLGSLIISMIPDETGDEKLERELAQIVEEMNAIKTPTPTIAAT